MLGSSDGAAVAAYDLAMLDLDGVVYVGPTRCRGGRRSRRARAAGMRCAFITNNASRPPETWPAPDRARRAGARPTTS